jgi:hypothetical protein
MLMRERMAISGRGGIAGVRSLNGVQCSKVSSPVRSTMSRTVSFCTSRVPRSRTRGTTWSRMASAGPSADDTSVSVTFASALQLWTPLPCVLPDAKSTRSLLPSRMRDVRRRRPEHRAAP